LCVRRSNEAARRRKGEEGEKKKAVFILGAVLICMLFFVASAVRAAAAVYGKTFVRFQPTWNRSSQGPEIRDKGSSGISSLADFSRFAKSRLSGQA